MIDGTWPEQPSPRFIFHRMLRRKELCPTPPNCPYVLMEDPTAGPDSLPCEGCPEQLLLEYLGSPGAQILSVVIDLDFALHMRMAVSLDRISYPEFLLLRQLDEEREKFQAEEIRKSSKRTQ